MLLSLLGKILITFAYAVVYLHGSEIFPTEVRNVGLGAASTIEGIGAMVAPPIGGPMVTDNNDFIKLMKLLHVVMRCELHYPFAFYHTRI